MKHVNDLALLTLRHLFSPVISGGLIEADNQVREYSDQLLVFPRDQRGPH